MMLLLLPPPPMLLLLPQLLFVLAGGGVVGGGGGGSGAVGGGCALPLPPSALPLPRREVVATTFTRVDGEVWTSWDWRSITTVIDVYRFGNETALVCAAHRHGARLLLNMGDKELLDWGLNRSRDLENRSAFESLAAKVAAVGADGVSLDIESNAATDPTRQAALRESLTLFTERLRAALRRSNPAAVLIFCVTAYPDRPDSNKGAWPHFDLAALSKATDWFFVMAYGTDEWRDNRTAIANSNIDLTRSLIADFPKVGVPLTHLVLGLPWYGYDNTCVESTRPDARICVRGKSGRELGTSHVFAFLPVLIRADSQLRSSAPHCMAAC